MTPEGNTRRPTMVGSPKADHAWHGPGSTRFPDSGGRKISLLHAGLAAVGHLYFQQLGQLGQLGCMMGLPS